jgi:serine/threonine-protein kinase ATR
MAAFAILFTILCSLCGTIVAWNADAGLVKPLAASSRTVQVTSNPASAANVVDGNELTSFWQSGACFPTGFIARADMNTLLNICQLSPAACAVSAGSSNINSAFDNSFYTGTPQLPSKLQQHCFLGL